MCSQKRKASGGPADASLRTSGYVLDVSVDGFLQFLGALENPVPRASSNPSMGLRSLPATRPDAEYAPIWTSNTRRWREGRIEVKFHRREARTPDAGAATTTKRYLPLSSTPDRPP